jgi:hypothetical protein
VKQEKKEKTFIVTDENRGIIGVVSALAPRKSCSKNISSKIQRKMGNYKKRSH